MSGNKDLKTSRSMSLKIFINNLFNMIGLTFMAYTHFHFYSLRGMNIKIILLWFKSVLSCHILSCCLCVPNTYLNTHWILATISASKEEKFAFIIYFEFLPSELHFTISMLSYWKMAWEKFQTTICKVLLSDCHWRYKKCYLLRNEKDRCT